MDFFISKHYNIHELYLRTRDILKKNDLVYISAFFSGNKNKDNIIKLK